MSDTTEQQSQEKVQMSLVGVDGNAFFIMGAFRSNASRQGFSEEFIDSVLDEAMSGDYNHLLKTIMNNITND